MKLIFEDIIPQALQFKIFKPASLELQGSDTTIFHLLILCHHLDWKRYKLITIKMTYLNKRIPERSLSKDAAPEVPEVVTALSADDVLNKCDEQAVPEVHCSTCLVGVEDLGVKDLGPGRANNAQAILECCLLSAE